MIPLDLEPGETVEVLIRLRFNVDLEIEPSIQDATRFCTAEASEVARQFVFYDVGIALPLISLPAAVALGFRPAAIYALFITSLLLWNSHLDGSAFRNL